MRLLLATIIALTPMLAPAAQDAQIVRLWEASFDDSVHVKPLAADLSGEGTPTLVICSRNSGALRLFDDEGRAIRTLRLPGELTGWAAAADLDADGAAELIAADASGNLRAWRGSGTMLWQFQLDSGVKWTAPLAVDLLGDARPEIVVATTEGKVWCFNSRGRPLWKHELAEGWWPLWGLIEGAPIAANVDGKGRPEILIATHEGFVYCLDARGTRLWTARLRAWGTGAPAVADFDGDLRLEVLQADWSGTIHCLDAATGRQERFLDAGGEIAGSVGVLRMRGAARGAIASHDGRVGIICGSDLSWIWGSARDEMKAATSPCPIDFDGDGDDEIALLTTSGHFVILNHGGTELVRTQTGVEPGPEPLIADINGDERLEVVVAGRAGRVECYRLPPQARIQPVGIPAPHLLIDAPRAPRPSRLSGITAQPLWWSDAVAEPAVLITNKAVSARQIEYLIALYEPDGRLASTAGTISLPAGGTSAIPVPFVALQKGRYVLDCRLAEGDKAVSLRFAHQVAGPLHAAKPETPRPAATMREPPIPPSWRMPPVWGRDFWHVARYQPGKWSEYGLADEPFIKRALPRVWAPPAAFKRDFALDSRVRKALLADNKPIMLMNDYFRPEAAVDEATYDAFLRDFGPRFVGFAFHEWAYGTVTGWFDRGELPSDRADAAKRLAEELRRFMALTYGRSYGGEGYRLPYHLAFREGLPAAYAEVGENIPATPLQVAMIRGAARQYGRPWGFYISAWFRGSVTTYDSPAPGRLASSGGNFSGPFAGHSVSLMERMLYLGYLSGATLVHHESDSFATSIWVENYDRKGDYHLSPFGLATRRWFDLTERHPDRGVPYTPFAIMIDANHGWCPAEDPVWRAFTKTPGERAMDEVTSLFFPWGFSTAGETGYLAHGPLGDTVDFISQDAGPETLQSYPVIMLLGDVPMDQEAASRLRRYVASGGTLVMDAAQPAVLLGEAVAQAWASDDIAYAAGAKQADRGVIATVSYAYRPLRQGIGSVLWRTGDGRPLAVEIPYESGRIVLIAAPHMLDIRGRLLPFVRPLVARLYDGLMPVQVIGDIEFTLARSGKGWVVGLINSKGVIKRPTEPVQAITRPDSEVEIAAPWRASLIQEWTTDTRLQNLSTAATRVSVAVPPGQVRVVFLGRK